MASLQVGFRQQPHASQHWRGAVRDHWHRSPAAQDLRCLHDATNGVRHDAMVLAGKL